MATGMLAVATMTTGGELCIMHASDSRLQMHALTKCKHEASGSVLQQAHTSSWPSAQKALCVGDAVEVQNVQIARFLHSKVQWHALHER